MIATIFAIATITVLLVGYAGQTPAQPPTPPVAPTQPAAQPPTPAPEPPVTPPAEEEPEEIERVQINIAVGEGTGGMSFAGLMYDNYRGLTQNDYNFTVASGQVTQAGLLSGEFDMGAMAINIAATRV